jgi:WD40 repeat protein
MEETEPTESSQLLPFARHHAYIVGIDAYALVSPLQTAVNDARKLADVLSLQQHFTVHPPLFNATGEALWQLLRETLKAEVGADDRVLFYFAGHGIAGDGDDGPAGFIVPADAVPTDPKTFVPMEALSQALDALPCRHLLLILDCCFSGAFKWSTRSRGMGALMPKRIYKERFDRFIADPAWQVLTSAAYDQKAMDVLQGTPTGDRGVKASDQEAPHSPFALALFEGLAGAADAIVDREGDGVITVTELYSYIRDQVEPETIREGQTLRQTPGFFPLPKHDKGEFIFLHPRHRLNLPPIPKRSPYKGLQSFDEADKELFYGREHAVADLRARAVTCPLLVVSGASGTGKSSVIKAGLLPKLREEGYRILPVIRPGIHPLATLEQVLQDASGPPPEGAAGKADPEKTVLVVDQYEELITRCTSPDERAEFVVRLRHLLEAAPAGALKIILTVRSDFEPQLNDGALQEYWMAGRCTVPPFSVEELKEIILMPLIQEVLLFDPPELVDTIIEEVVQSPGALPLLSYTLDELYEAYRTGGRQDRALKAEDYQRLGGVMGALRTRADALYQQLDEEAQGTMRKLMLRMVSVDGEVAGKRVAMEELQYDDPAENQRVQAVVEQLVGARLIVKGRDYIEPAHDALVRAWKTLREWVHGIGEDKIILNAKLNVAATEFAQSRNVRFLWNDNPHLDVLQQELANPRQWFNRKEIAFIRESVRRRKKLSRIVRATTGAVLAALSALTVWAVLSRQAAIHNLQIAETDLLAIRATKALATDNTQALRLAQAAYTILEKDPPVVAQQILSKAFHTVHDRTIFYAANLPHGGEVTAAAFAPSGDRLLTASTDGTARLWDLTGKLRRTFISGSEPMALAVYSPRGTMILTATREGKAALWDANGVSLGVTLDHPGPISSAAFSPDETILVTACADDTARIWTVQGKRVASLGHANQVFSAVFDATGRHILTASADGLVKLWDRDGSLIRTVSRHPKAVNRAVFAPGDSMVLSASRDGDAALWDLDGRLLQRLPHARGQEVFAAEFAPGGQSILTASLDHTARLWDLQGHPLASLAHAGGVYSAHFSPDGGNIVTASADSTARLWDRRGGLLAILKHHGEVRRAVFSPSGQQVLTASEDGTARLWDLDGIQLAAFATPGEFAAFSRDGKRIITTGPDGTARLWDTGGKRIDSVGLGTAIEKVVLPSADPRILLVQDDGVATYWSPEGGAIVARLRHQGQSIASAAVSPDGRRILTVTIDHVARLWDLSRAADAAPRVVRLQGMVSSAVFSPVGDRILTTASDGFARLSDSAGRQLDSLGGAGAPLTFALFSPAATQILAASEDGVVRLWSNRKELVDSFQAGEIEAAAFSPDGTRILLLPAGDGPVWLRSLRTRHTDSLIHPHETAVRLAIFSPDGSQILTGAADGVARLWNGRGELLAELAGHGGRDITSIAFAPDGRSILTAALDNRVQLWWTPGAIFEWLKRASVYRLMDTGRGRSSGLDDEIPAE